MTEMTQVSFRIDKKVKEDAESILNDLGLSMSAAITVFLKAVGREHRIPFELTLDPFYTDSNLRYLERKMADYKAGRLPFEEHSLIEEE